MKIPCWSWRWWYNFIRDNFHPWLYVPVMLLNCYVVGGKWCRVPGLWCQSDCRRRWSQGSHHQVGKDSRDVHQNDLNLRHSLFSSLVYKLNWFNPQLYWRGCVNRGGQKAVGGGWLPAQPQKCQVITFRGLQLATVSMRPLRKLLQPGPPDEERLR